MHITSRHEDIQILQFSKKNLQHVKLTYSNQQQSDLVCEHSSERREQSLQFLLYVAVLHLICHLLLMHYHTFEKHIIYKSGIQVLPPGHFQVRGIYNQGIRPGVPWCSVATNSLQLT